MAKNDSFTSGVAVSTIPELLEMILVKLDMKTLLLSERTCKAFQATIADSKKLQIKLFMAIDPNDENKQVNTLLFCNREGFRSHLALKNAAGSGFAEFEFLNEDSQILLDLDDIKLHQEKSLTGSWQRMFANLQPTHKIQVPMLKVHTWCRSTPEKPYIWHTTSGPSTMGAMMDFAMRVLQDGGVSTVLACGGGDAKRVEGSISSTDNGGWHVRWRHTVGKPYDSSSRCTITCEHNCERSSDRNDGRWLRCD